MIYLIIDLGQNNYVVVSPATYGMDTWCKTSKVTLEKDDKNMWYRRYSFIDVCTEEEFIQDFKIDVVLETTDIHKILIFILKHNEISIEMRKEMVNNLRIINDEYLKKFELKFLDI